jgi:hypothetical protein
MSSDSRHFRTQAEIYFELARHMSLRSDAEIFRATAQAYLARAGEEEALPLKPQSSPPDE